MIYEKRGRWCFRDSEGRLRKFDTKEAAELAAAGVIIVKHEPVESPVEDEFVEEFEEEILDGEEEEEDY